MIKNQREKKELRAADIIVKNFFLYAERTLTNVSTHLQCKITT